MFIYAKKTSLGARFTAIVLCLAILCSGSAFSGLFFRSFLSPGPAWAEIFDYTVKEEKELGEKFNAMVRARLPIVEDPELTTYVRSIVDKLGTAMRATSFPLTVAVVRSNQANAFAGPSGYMYIFTGLILTMENESELASVIAHEMAHISQKHIAKRMREMKALSIASMLGVVAGMLLGGLTGSSDAAGAAIAGTQAAAASAMLKYSRDDENEADHVGLNYMVGGGFNPRGMPAAFDILRKQKGLKGYGNIPAYLSTHPDLTERSSYLDRKSVV